MITGLGTSDAKGIIPTPDGIIWTSLPVALNTVWANEISLLSLYYNKKIGDVDQVEHHIC